MIRSFMLEALSGLILVWLVLWVLWLAGQVILSLVVLWAVLIPLFILVAYLTDTE